MFGRFPFNSKVFESLKTQPTEGGKRMKRKPIRVYTMEKLEDRLVPTGPQLVSIIPNAGELLREGDKLNVAPKELTVRFNEGQVIDAASLGGIRLIGSGSDGVFDGGRNIADGASFQINDGVTTVVFEFDKNDLAALGSLRVPINDLQVPSEVADAMASAINGSALNVVATLSGQTVNLAGAVSVVVGPTAGLQQNGTASLTVPGNTVVVTPGFIAVGDRSNEVVMRFAETLPDDNYEIQFLGDGPAPLRNDRGEAFIADTVRREFTSTAVPRAIPDNGTVASTVDVTESVDLAGVVVEFDITHPVSSDIQMFLTSPTGTRIMLFNNVGDGGPNFTNTVLDDDARTLITFGSAPFTGRFRPLVPFNSFAGEDSLGIWTLEIVDNVATNTGNLNSWSLTTVRGTPRDAVPFELDLAPQVIAVVPQPITRAAGGGLQQALDQVVVHFNNDDLDPILSQTPAFYQLIDTRGTLDPLDDILMTPDDPVSPVTYDAGSDTAVLDFANPIPRGTYRLRIGNNDPLSVAATTQNIVIDGGNSTFASALPLGSLGNPLEINAAIDPELYGLAFPGANNEPGHRDIPQQTHLELDGDFETGITTAYYNFQIDAANPGFYGFDPSGNPLFNVITDEQRQRAREIFELWGRFLGIKFVETIDDTVFDGITIVTGDMRVLAPTFPIGPNDGVLGVSTTPTPLNPVIGGMVIVDAAENWGDSEYGGQYFQVAMHEIGHQLGIGHSFDLPGLTIQGQFGAHGGHDSPTHDFPKGVEDPFALPPGVPTGAVFDLGDSVVTQFPVIVQPNESRLIISPQFEPGRGLGFHGTTPFLAQLPDGTPIGWADHDTSTSEIIDVFYDFRNVGAVQNEITSSQIRQAERAFEAWSAATGGRLKFTRRTDVPNTEVLIVGTGNLSAVGGVSGPGGILGLGGFQITAGAATSGFAWMDNAETWDTTHGNGNTSFFGPDYYSVAAHEIGHALGLGHTTDVIGPDVMDGALTQEHSILSQNDIFLIQTLYGSTTAAANGQPNNGGELVFPGFHDITHGQFLFRPESKDIDLYSFRLDEPGELTAEIVAERLGNSSLLDSVLTLYNSLNVLQAPEAGGAGLIDGSFFDIDDGVNTVRFEFDENAGGLLNAGAVPIEFVGGDGPSRIASLVASAINNSQLVTGTPLNVVARVIGNRVELEGPITLTNASGMQDSVRREVVSRNDDYFSKDAFVRLRLPAGSYFLAVTSTGNTNFDPNITDSGIGGTTQGDYQLRLNFHADPAASLTDATGLVLDGDVDGEAGGVYNFWFQANDSGADALSAADDNTIYVDKSNDPLTNTSGAAEGTLLNPYPEIDRALAAAAASTDRKIVRIIGNGGADGNLTSLGDNQAYQLGVNNFGQALPDGAEMKVPAGVTVMIDAGAVLKLRQVIIDVGSDNPLVNRAQGALQVLGTPTANVVFTSFRNDLIGGNDDGASVGARPGDWGGILLRADSDREQNGVFLSTINHADIAYAGRSEMFVSPIQLIEARPTIAHNLIHHSTAQAIGADPNSFEETLLGDYDRVGPEIHGNRLVDNGLNGLFIEVRTDFGNQLRRVETSTRWDDADIVHVVAENIILQGTPGGPVLAGGTRSTVSEVEPNNTAAGAQNLDVSALSLRANANIGDATTNTSTAIGHVTVTATGDGTFDYYSFDIAAIPAAPGFVRGIFDIDFGAAVGTGFIDTELFLFDSLGNLLAENDDSPITTGAGGSISSFDSFLEFSFTTPGRYVVAVGQFPSAASPTGVIGSPPAAGTSYTLQVSLDVPVAGGASDGVRNARLDARLAVDPGVIVKLGGARIEADIASQFIAEGEAGNEVIFTSIKDDSYGASGTSDSNSDRLPLVRVTEIDLSATDFFEIQNLSGNLIDTTGWRVVVSNDPLNINVANPVTFPLPGYMVDGQILTRSDAAAAANFTGVDLNWTAGQNGWIMILDGSGDVIDWVGWGWTDAQIASFNVTTGGQTISGLLGSWTGPSAPSSGSGTLQRLGAADTNTAADFAFVATPSLGSENENLDSFQDPDSIAEPGDWGGLFFRATSTASIDRARIQFGGGETSIEGDFDFFNVIEIHQSDARITNSTIRDNAPGVAGTLRNGRGDNAASVIFVRGSQPVIANNVIRNNISSTGDAISAIHIDANSLVAAAVSDPGRSTGQADVLTGFADNRGPLVRGNRLGETDINGMTIRGGTLTAESVWDDTDIVHVLFDEIVTNNFHTFSGLRIQSSPDESLVVKLRGADAGFTASGTPLDIDDRIGGTIQAIGTPGHAVIFTSLADCAVGAGLSPTGQPQTGTDFATCAGGPGNSGAVVIDGGDRDDFGHGFADPGPDGVLGTPDDINRDGWRFIEQMVQFAFAGSGKTTAANDVLVIGATAGGIFGSPALEAITSVTTVLGLNMTVVVGAQILAEDFNDYKMIYVPSNDTNTFGGISEADIALLAQRRQDIQRYVNTGGSLVALTEAESLIPFSWLELPLPFQITDFTAGGIIFPLRKTPEAIAAGFTISDAELSLGVPYHNDFVGPPGFNGLQPFVRDTGNDLIPDNGDDRVITLGLGRGSAGLGVFANPGDWRSLRFDTHSNDRNVALINELESAFTGGDDGNAEPADAQSLGNLAPHEKAGDENRRLGFEVHGAISFDDPTDVDVYSFTANPGTEVWFDVDRTTHSLDTVIELLDATGNVLARSNDNDDLFAGTFQGNPVAVNPLQRSPFDQQNFLGEAVPGAVYLGGPGDVYDLYTTNPRDAGMRVVLPAPPGTTVPPTYYLRVRSNPQPIGAIGDLNGGLSKGSYQVQIRLREVDEVAGSTVRFADIRFAQNGIEAIGLPKNSPLLGEASEAPGDAVGTTNPDEGIANAETLGNLLQTNRNTISVGGDLVFANDVDWYEFSIDLELIQSLEGVNANTLTWATVFDVDYADGLARPDTTLYVFDSAGNLVLVSRDSDVLEDQPRIGEGSDSDDLSRGSFGKHDPYIGSSQLPEGDYFLAVSSNSQLASELNQTFLSGALNPLVRLEPVNGTIRIAEDHIGLQGHTTGVGAASVTPVTPLFDVSSSLELATHVTPFNLADVTLFVSTQTRISAVDPFTGNFEYIYNAGVNAGGSGVQDIAQRSDGRLMAVRNVIGAANTNNASELIEISTNNAAVTAVGTDTISDMVLNSPTADALAYLRNPGVAIGNTTFNYDLVYSVRGPGLSSTLFQINPASGSGTPAAGQPQFPIGEIFQLTPGDLGVTTGLAFIQFGQPGGGTLFGVNQTGQFYEIDTFTGRATNVVTVSAGAPFAGLAIGPQSLQGGAFATTFFAITSDGRLFAIDSTGAPRNIFDSNDDGIADSNFTATVGGATGLAFSVLDFNLWHPTRRRGPNAGHGINEAFDRSRDFNDLIPFVVDGCVQTEREGGANLHFGIEQWVQNPTCGSNVYLPYDGINAQLGISSQTLHEDLTSNPAIGGTYNLPGGAKGSLVTNPFSLLGYSATDKPTLYFNYFLETENANSAGSGMRDSARAFASRDGGLTWELLATNNSTRVGVELPLELSTSGSGQQRVQELFDNTGGWRQARVDLGDFAGEPNLLLRFDFATAGSQDDPGRLSDSALPGDIHGNPTVEGRSQNNGFEGFYIDDVIIGFAERGEMVTAASGNTGYFTVDPPNLNNATPGSSQVLTGRYQVEIRRGEEYADEVFNTVFPDIAIVRQFDTNDRHTAAFTLRAPAGSGITDGAAFEISDGLRSVSFEFDSDNAVGVGNIAIAFTGTESAFEIARRMVLAINNAPFEVTADSIATSEQVHLVNATLVRPLTAPTDLTVTVDPLNQTIPETGGTTMATVTRENNPISDPLALFPNDLVVTISALDPRTGLPSTQVVLDTLTMSPTTTVTIPAGSAVSPAITVTAIDDTLADGTQAVVLRAVAAGFNSVTGIVDVTDDETPALSVTLTGAPTFAEDGTTTARVFRNTPTDQPLVVTLRSSDLGEATIQGSAVQLYGNTRNGELFAIDVATGAVTLVGVLPFPSTEIEFDPISGRAFAQGSDGSFFAQEFDVNTGAGIGAIIPNGGSFAGLEYVGGILYGTVHFAGGGNSPSQLRTLDPTTGTSTVIGATGLGAIAGLAYDSVAGIMYGVTGGTGASDLVTIDLTTGAATVIGSTGFQAGSLEFGPDGLLYAGGTGTSGGNFFRVDPATGAGTLIGPTGFPNITGLTLVNVTALGQVIIPAGSDFADFTIAGVQDNLVDGDQPVSVHAMARGFGSDSVDATVTDTGVVGPGGGVSFTVGSNVNVSRAVGSQADIEITVNPVNPNNVFAISGLDSGLGLLAARSVNGGQTWTVQAIANGFFTFPFSFLVPASGSPNAAFDQFGNLFITYLDDSVNPNVIVGVSTNGGSTFNQIANLGPGRLPKLATGPNSVFVAWSDTATTLDIRASGATVVGLGALGAFSAPQAVPASAGQSVTDIAIGSTGQVAVAFQNLTVGAGPSTIAVSLDADGVGAGGFGASVSVTSSNTGGFDQTPAQSGRGVDTNATLAFDRSGGTFAGRLYMVYSDETPNETNNFDVVLRFSDDDGATWSAPLVVNDDATANAQFLPHVSVDPLTGNVAVTWHDARDDSGVGAFDTDGVPNTDTVLYGAISIDGGASFLPNFQIADGVSNAGRASSPVDYGGYRGSAYHNGVLLPAWADNSATLANNPEPAEFDIATARVTLAVGAESLSVAIAATTIGESPALAPTPISTTATVSRTGDTTNPLFLQVRALDPFTGLASTEVTLPGFVFIPAGSATSFPFTITANNDLFNPVADGTQAVLIQATAAGFNSGIDVLDVLDDETAALAVTILPTVIQESDGASSATGTVSRNTRTDADLVVTLIADNTSEVRVVGTVTIPAGQTSATFDIAAIDEFFDDGTQLVTITAVAAGLASGSANMLVTATDNVEFYNRTGDSNTKRDQGRLLLESNQITDSLQFGIRVVPGTRPNDTSLSNYGSVRNLPTLNNPLLAPGVVIQNNLIAYSGSGGIDFLGDINAALTGPPRPGGMVATSAVPFGKLINNTIFGDVTAVGVGINVADNASPTILNSIIANTATAINVATDSSTTVVGTNLFQNNTAIGRQGIFPILLANTEPLFIDAAAGNFYLADGSRAVDSSINQLDERAALSAVNQPLGIADSPILAPDIDLIGQRRVDDPSQDPPPGLGSNIFKDRGALERADFFGPTVLLLTPEDNDGAGIDLNPARTQVLVNGDVLLTEIVLQLIDDAAGIDDLTAGDVTNYTIFADRNLDGFFDDENGDGAPDPLQLDRDYLFSYDTTNNVVRFTAVEGVYAAGRYQIVLDNDLDGIRDLAQNLLQPNQVTGETQFTIVYDAETPSATLVVPQDNGATDADPAVDRIVVLDAGGNFVIQLNDALSGIDDNSVLNTLGTDFTVNYRVPGTVTDVDLVEGQDFDAVYNPTTNQITLTVLPFGVFSPPVTRFPFGQYTITLGDGVAGGNDILDNAGNLLQDNEIIVVIRDLEIGAAPTLAEGDPIGNTYSVRLGQQPTSNVQVNLTTNGQLTAVDDANRGNAFLVFTAANWNLPQLVRVIALEDAIAEGSPHDGIVLHTVSSADPTFGGLTGVVTIDILDNDTAGLLIVETGGSTDVAETGGSDTYTIRLSSQPTAAVVISLTSNGQVAAEDANSPGVEFLVFNSNNWNVPRTVRVTAVNDGLDEANIHLGQVINTATSLDPTYDGMAETVDVNVTDDDTFGITLRQGSNSTDVSEGTADDLYSIVLNSQPRNTVTITITDDAQVLARPDASPGSTTLVFTAANWNVPQLVRVSGNVDGVDEVDPHPGVITHAVASLDPDYNNFPLSDVIANVFDPDVARIVIFESAATTDVAEGGAADTFEIRLSTQPTQDVAITLTTPGGNVRAVDDANPANEFLIFTPLNWDVPQRVRVSALDDSVAEGTHTGTIALVSSSLDPAYGTQTATVLATITDNDVAGLAFVQSDNSTDVVEGGRTDTYTVRLTSQPTANVTVNLNANAQVQADSVTVPGSTALVFTPANWNVPQVVRVTAVDDAAAELSPHPGQVVHAILSADTFYTGLSAPLSVNVFDNDLVGILVIPNGSIDVTEGGVFGADRDVYLVQLASQPADVVTVALASDGQTSVVSDVNPLDQFLTFTPANWNTPQAVRVVAVNDSFEEPTPHFSAITHTATSNDAAYNGLTAAAIANVTDNDAPGLTVIARFVDPISGDPLAQVTEGGATDTFSVVLQSQPTAPVTVALSGDSQVVVVSDANSSSTVLTFTAANWNVPQLARVQAVNDSVREANPHRANIVLTVSSADADYNNLTSEVRVDVTDNDVPALLITETPPGTSVTESGQTDTYTVVLTTQPTGDVIINLSGGGQVSAIGLSSGSSSLLFTPANWNVPQTVQVSAVDDAVDETATHLATITQQASSTDPDYSGRTVALSVSVTDNDTAGLVIALSNGSTAVSENGGVDTYTVSLSSEPTAAVTVTLQPNTQVQASPTTLTFTPTNWNVPQTVNVSAIDDLVDEPEPHRGTLDNLASSADPFYNGLSQLVEVAVSDNDIAGITITQSNGSTDVTEAGTDDIYTVVLNTQPTADVTIQLSPDAQVTVINDGNGGNTLVFTPANWAIPQVVRVTAVDDLDDETDLHASQVTQTATSLDANYNGLAQTIPVTVTDNEFAGFALSATALAVAEGGASATYTLALTTRPTANVTVSLLTGSEISAVTDDQNQLGFVVFTPQNWNVPRSIRVTAMNDAIDEGVTTNDVITHSAVSTDSHYSGLTRAIPVSVTDNDTAGYVIAPSNGSTAVAEGGPADTYTIRLSSQPTQPVTISLAPLAGQDATASPGSVTFDASNWNAEQTISVQAIDDVLVEAMETTSVQHFAFTNDPVYGGLVVPDVLVTISDNDLAPTLTGIRAENLGVSRFNGKTNITGTFIGNPGTTYTLVFQSRQTPASAIASLGTLTFTTDAGGRADYAFRFDSSVNGEFVQVVVQRTGPGGPVVATLNTGLIGANATGNRAFVSGAYNDLLGRDGTLAEFLDFEGSAQSRLSFVAGISADGEFDARTVTDFYRQFLRRPPTSTELAAGVSDLQNGGTNNSVRVDLLSSNDYYTQFGGGNDTGFVNAFYQDVFGRLPTALELEESLLDITEGGRFLYAQSRLRFTEFHTVLIHQIHQTYLGRNATTDELTNFRQLLSAGAREDVVVNSVVSSNEYFGIQLAKSIHLDYLQRPASSTEISDGVSFIVAGGSEFGLRASILGGNEFFQNAGSTNASFVSDAYLDIFGRSATQAEVSSGVASLTTMTREQFALSLLNTPEYAARNSGVSTPGDPSSVDLPINQFADNFNRADSLSMGPAWTERSGELQVVNNRLEPLNLDVALATVNNLQLVDGEVSANVSFIPGADAHAGLVLRHSDQGMYLGALVQLNGALSAQIWRNVAGNWDFLTSVPVSASSGLLSFSVTGDLLTLHFDGATVGVTDDSLTGAGTAGIRGSLGIYDDFAVQPSQESHSNTFHDPFASGAVLSASWSQQLGDFDVTLGSATAMHEGLNVATVDNMTMADVSVAAHVALPQTPSHAGLLARYQGTGDGQQAYLGALVHDGASTTAQIWRNVGGSWDLLAAGTVSGLVGALRFEVEGRSLLLFFNDSLVASASDSTITAPGHVGIRGMQGSAYGNFDAGTMSSSTPTGVVIHSGDFTLHNDELMASAAGTSLATVDAITVANVAVEAEITVQASGNNHAGLVARHQSNGNMYLGALVGVDGSYSVQIWKSVGGIWTQLGSHAVSGNHGLVRFEADGNSLRLSLDGNLLLSVIDSDIAGAGHVGVRGSQGSTFGGFRQAQ